GLAPTRTRAQALILAGAVLTESGARVEKPGELVSSAERFVLKGEPQRYVSRGGTKLEAALQHFQIDVGGRVALDIGASTGGFTDCLLQHGATRVYAVDVGYGQLAWALRQDARVVTIERANIRHLARESIPEACSIVVIDVSFISLKLVVPEALRFCERGADLVALVKPQFEVGRAGVGKGGIVRDPELRARALSDIAEFCSTSGLSVRGTMASPILGAKGNEEYLLHATLAVTTPKR
ncbi:MAG: TlyA family RNA methyltransferase, partial [Myxococcota bacterium]